jgi:hypothetical protein
VLVTEDDVEDAPDGDEEDEVVDVVGPGDCAEAGMTRAE